MSYRDQLDQLISKVKANPDPIAPLHYVYQFNLEGEAPFQIKFDSGTVEVLEEAGQTADCTLIMSPTHFVKLLNDDLNTTMAFMLGNLKVEGRMGLALKLQEILKQYN